MMQTPPPDDEIDVDFPDDRPGLMLMKGLKSDKYIDDEYVEHQSTMSKQITRTNYNSPTSSIVGGAHPAINCIKDMSNDLVRENARTAFLASAIKIQ
jgi:hypothetical protein